MKNLGAILVFVFASMSVFSQLPSKVKKLEGTWEFKFGSGFEVMEVKDGELIGQGYRVHRKSLDTSCVEHTRIRMVGKNLIYSMTTFNIAGDSVTSTVLDFVSDGKKMKFSNISEPTPYAIYYTFGFLNRNKLIIHVYHGPETKPIKLYLTRKKTN